MAHISIIIPCYNAENCIQNCFESLENQTIGIQNLEIIFVNDASTDQTLLHLYKFQEKYPDNVMVIDCKQNGRQGAARNIGLRHATSNYIGFADDDDLFEPQMYEDMYKKAEQYQCDMVICNHDTIYEPVFHQPAEAAFESDSFFIISTEEERLGFITTNPVRCIWDKLYKRELIEKNHLQFPEGYIYDDIYFFEMVKLYVNRVYKINNIYYHHYIQKNSASIDFSQKENMLGFLDVEISLLDEIRHRDFYSAYWETYSETLALDAIGLVKTYLIRYGQIEADILKRIKHMLLPYRDDCIKNNLLSPLFAENNTNPDSKILKLLFF